MIAIFHEHYKVRYAPRGMGAWVLYILTLLLTLGLSFILCYFTQDFWSSVNFVVTMPKYAFTERCALTVRTVMGKEYLWTCNDVLNEGLVGSPLEILPFLSVSAITSEELSWIIFTLSVPINDFNTSIYENPENLPTDTPLDAVDEVVFLPELSCQIKHEPLEFHIITAPLFTYQRKETFMHPTTATTFSSGPVCALTEADADFITTAPISAESEAYARATYAQSPFEVAGFQPSSLLDLRQFATGYTARNQTIQLRVLSDVEGGMGVLPVEQSINGLWDDLGSLNDFTWVMKLRLPAAVIPYAPSFWESLKFAWVQFFACAFIFQWLMWNLRGIIVKAGMVDTNAFFHTRRAK